METNFERAFDFAMKWERHRSDDPRDPGGLTIWGISSKYWPDVVAQIKDLPKEESLAKARDFYHEKYWLKMGCDRIGSPLDIVVFDTAIIPGPKAATVLLEVTHDWRDYLFLRIAHLASSSVADTFLKGWINRIMDLWRMVKKV